VNSRARARAGRLRAAALWGCAALTMTCFTATRADAQTGGLTLAGAGTKAKVRYGEPLELSGRVPVAGTVRLEYAPRGGGWRSVDQTVAATGGSYHFKLRPKRSGAFRAVTSEGVSSARIVTVVARLAGRTSHHVRAGAPVRVRGRLVPGFGGRRVRLQLATGRGWRTVDRTLTGRGGRFRAKWRATGSGRYRLRVKFAGDGRNAAVSRTLRGRVYVYRASEASWYGPGLYGNHTACGGVLGYDTLGVAHKWLPCGTRVTFRYSGRSVTVPVIDRGPFGPGREWDLTSATKRRLGFGDVGIIWSAH
jgi:rare lipoprotein A